MERVSVTINNDYIADRLREIADDLDTGRITLIKYQSGEGVSNAAFSGHSLELVYRRTNEDAIPVMLFPNSVYGQE